MAHNKYATPAAATATTTKTLPALLFSIFGSAKTLRSVDTMITAGETE